jgi:predicted metalloprotease
LPDTPGTVLFGERYFQKWLNYDPTGVAVLVIIAHEFGHILQYKSGRFREIQGGLPTSKRIELHADFMSGFYVGILRKQHPSASFWKAGDQIRQIGSYDETSPDFHGTPEQRVAASQAGFGCSYTQGLGVDAAFDAGVRYVSTA